MTNQIILTDRDHVFSYTILADGIGVIGLTYDLIIQRISDNKYWNGTAWQVGSIVTSLSERGKGNYYYEATYADFFESGSTSFDEGIRLTHSATKDGDTYADYIEDVDCALGTPINKQTVRDSMALDTLEDVVAESIDDKLINIKSVVDTISNDQSTDKTEILKAITNGSDAVIDKLIEGKVVNS